MAKDAVKLLEEKTGAVKGGGFARLSRVGKKAQKSELHALVGRILEGIGVPYEEDVKVQGLDEVPADFRIGDRVILVERNLGRSQFEKLSKVGLRPVFISLDDLTSGLTDLGIRIGDGKKGSARQTIFLDDPSFAFDYSHILPSTQKCSVMHGHTSSVLVEVAGTPVDGMVVDFGLAKEVIRSATRELDHKLFINSKYVKSEDGKSVTLEFRTVHGDFHIKAPKATTVLMDGEATVENLAKEVLDRIAPGMPENVTQVGVYVYEGMNKGSHILAYVHQREASKARRKR